MATGTLYTYPNNFRADKILITAKFSGKNIDVVSEPPKFVFGETNKSEEFLKKFPAGKVPAFETQDGNCIFESNAIAHYVGDDQLRGKDAVEQAHIVQWINFADNEILPAVCSLAFPLMSIVQPSQSRSNVNHQAILKHLALLNSHLLYRTYLVGQRITQADIAVMSNLRLLFEHVLEKEARSNYGNVIRWFTTMINQPQVKSVIGEFKWCKKASTFDAAKFGELKKLSKSVTDDELDNEEVTPVKKPAEKPKEVKPVEKPKEVKKEKAKKKPEPEPTEELDEADAILAAEPQSKDPFDQLPKGTFKMDDFKRVYSNEDEKVSVPYFWEHFDKEHYSIWYCEYKYPEELTQVFMSCNLIAGMFQRLDKMRKNAFGSMVLFGTDNNSTISGIWIWRGHELAFPLNPDWTIDYESYAWKKLDPEVDDTKKMVNEYLSWSGNFGGKKFNQAKIFK